MSLNVSPEAAEDIRLIAERFAAFGGRTAAKFARNIRGALQLLDRLPEIGADLGCPAADGRPLRFVNVRGFPNILVVYELSTSGARVNRVLNGRRDVERLLTD